MTFFWICSFLAIGAAVAASFFSELKRAALALWVCALALGGVYLSLGAEYLAIVQWIVSTLGVAAFVFFSVLLGSRDGKHDWAKYLAVAGALVLLGGIIWMTVRDFVPSVVWDKDHGGMVGLGNALVTEYLLPVEILALTLFLVVVGAGVITRPEDRGEEEGGA
ncbi:MAG TPA: NADH-quinone oxidoreductase subunit J [Bdellovibrionota bacterium]|jgi:NADH-quinone oxidoreductase subunit J|nr:NADH-quinone oxidoreductase subunit J [Bdellovibrionota bacterium]